MYFPHNPDFDPKPNDILEYLAPATYGRGKPPIFYKVLRIDEQAQELILCKLELLSDPEKNKVALPFDDSTIANLIVHHA